MSNSQENISENENPSSDIATNHDNEYSTSDSKIEISKAKEENKRKLTSMPEEYEWDKKDESKEKEANCQRDIESESSSNNVGDICRICHMGNFPPLSVNRTLWERRTHQSNRPIDIQASSRSTFAYLGPLISACKCRGTVGLVHVECLERWLTESGHISCELCGHRFVTKRVPRHSVHQSIIIWFKTVFVTRQMFLDILYLAATTPLALFSIYICALAVKLLLQSGLYEIPWLVIAMLPTCSLTLVAYWGWLITLGRYITRFHSRRWQSFWRHNFIVRLIPENVNELSDATRESVDLSDNTEENELSQWQEEDVSNFLNVD